MSPSPNTKPHQRRENVAHGARRCERIGERQKYARAVVLSEAMNLALSSFAISHFHRQSEIPSLRSGQALRCAQDDSEGLRMTGWLILSQPLAPWATFLRPRRRASEADRAYSYGYAARP
jgi:hypothetical protein